jgi:ligand-binding sensor domain-containing protein
MVSIRLQPVFQHPARAGQKKMAFVRLVCLCLYLCLLLPFQVKAQYIYRHYSTIDGLPSSGVRNCVQDSAGFIWFATDKGLCRFDGSDFVDCDLGKYTNGKPTILSLAINNNKIIAGTYGGFLTVEGGNRIGNLGLVMSNPDYEAYQSVYANGMAYFATPDGHVAAFDPERKKKYLVGKQDAEQPFHMVKTADGRIYYGQNGLYSIRGLTTVKLQNVLPGKFISDLVVDAQDQVWISVGNTIYCMKNEVITDSVVCDFYAGHILYIYHNKMFGLMVTDDYGHYNEAYRKLSRLINRGSECIILTMFEDRDGNLWVNTNENGSFCVLNSYISVLTGNHGLFEASIRDINVNPAQEMYMATSPGIVYRNGNSFDLIAPKDGKYYIGITLAGNQWLASVFGMDAGRLEKIENKTLGKSYYRMLAQKLCMMSDSELVYSEWSNSLKMAVLDFRKGVLRNKDSIMLDTAVVRCTAMFRVDGSHVIVSTVNVCYMVDLKTKTFRHMREIGATVNDIIADASGTLYMASEAGLYVLRGNRTHLIKELRGLPLKNLSCLAIDGKKRLWIGSNKGLLVWKGDFVKRISGKPFMHSHEINRLFYEQTANRLYVATSSGLSVVDITKMDHRVVRKPDVIILKVQSGDSIYDAAQEVKLASKNDGVDIYFSAIELSSPHDLYFRYTLNKGRSWTIIRGKKMSLQDIGYGEHDVMIQASTNGVNWGRAAELKVRVDYPFYATLGFWLKVLLLAFIGAFVLIKFRIRKIREKAKTEVELQQKLEDLRYQALSAAVNPHFIFNTLGAIQSFVINKDPFEASDYIAKFARLIRITLSYAGEKYISIREEENRLNLYLALEKLRCGDKLEYSVHVHGSLDKHTMIPNMIIQPLLENAILHGILPLRIGVTGQLDVSIEQEHNCLVIRVRDNGVGITRHEHSSKHGYVSIGIDNLRERLSLVKGSELNIKNLRESHPGDRGTLVEIRLPF